MKSYPFIWYAFDGIKLDSWYEVESDNRFDIPSIEQKQIINLIFESILSDSIIIRIKEPNIKSKTSICIFKKHDPNDNEE